MKALGGRGTFAILHLATLDLLTIQRAGKEEGATEVLRWHVVSACKSSESVDAVGGPELADVEGVCRQDRVT